MALTPGRTRRPAIGGATSLLQVWASPVLKQLVARAAAADGTSVSFLIEELIWEDGLHESLTGTELLAVTGRKSTNVQARVNPEIGELAAIRAKACQVTVPVYLQMLIESNARARGYLSDKGDPEATGLGQAELDLKGVAV